MTKARNFFRAFFLCCSSALICCQMREIINGICYVGLSFGFVLHRADAAVLSTERIGQAPAKLLGILRDKVKLHDLVSA